MFCKKTVIAALLLLILIIPSYSRTLDGKTYQFIKDKWFLVSGDDNYEVEYSLIFVKFDTNTPLKDIDKLNSDLNMSTKYVTDSGFYALEFNSAEDPVDKIEAYLGNKIVKSASVNFYGKYLQRDQYFSELWHLTNIKCNYAWPYETGNSDVIISILDSGTDYNHIDLSSNIWHNPGETENPGDENDGEDDDSNGYIDDIYGWNFGENNNNPSSSNGHGTHVAGIAAAITHNGIGVAGVAGGWSGWNGCKLQICALGDDRPTIATVERAIQYARNNHADIINMSIGLGIESVDIVEEQLDSAYEEGIVLVAGTGNSPNFPDVLFPANHENVIAVGSSRSTDEISWYTTTGEALMVLAPGGEMEVNDDSYPVEEIKSTWPDDEYRYMNGTSVSSPIVAGLAGLLLSNNSNYSNDDIAMIICRSAEKIDYSIDNYTHNKTYGKWDSEMGYGRINALYALAEPDVPTSLQVSGSNGQSPTLTWNTSEAADVKDYVIKRVMETMSSNITHYITISANSPLDETQSWTDTDVVIDNTGVYDIIYRVKAVDYTDKPSTYSNSVTIEYDGGIWKTTPGFEENGLPTEFSILDPYPSPFNAMTTICFDIPETSEVTITIFNTQGRLIEELACTSYTPGTHKITWEAGNHSSGVYFVQMKAKNFRAMKRVVLVK